MIVTVASFKGGVGKTTTAVHLAGYFETCFAPTLLVDGDPNRSASSWAERGSFPFKVIDERSLAKHARSYEYIVIDTEARPKEEDLKALAEGCDLLVLPTTPDALALDALLLTIDSLRNLKADQFKVLLTQVPPLPNRDGEEARKMLLANDLPVFNDGIPRLVAFPRAALQGVLVKDIKHEGAKAAWSSYQQVGKEVLPWDPVHLTH